MEVDEALARLGSIGRWQIRHFTVTGIALGFPPCFHMLAINYIGMRASLCCLPYTTQSISILVGDRQSAYRYATNSHYMGHAPCMHLKCDFLLSINQSSIINS